MHVYDWNSMQPDVVTELYRRTVAQGEKMSVARLEVAKAIHQLDSGLARSRE